MAGGPWISFAVTVSLALVLYMSGGGQRSHIVGFAEGESITSASTETGRIVSIEVQVGQEVVPGQILATLDPSAIDAEIAVAEAERARLAALLPASIAAEAQRLDQSVEALELAIAKEQEEFGGIKSELKVLEDERARAKKLVEDRLAVSDGLSQLDVRYSSIKPLADAKPRTLDLLKKQLASAEKRRKEAAGTSGAATKGLLGGDLLLTTRELEQLRQRRNELVLRATAKGRVSQILKRAGEVAVAGEPIVSTVSTRARVIACVPESQALRVGVGDRAKLWFRDAPGAPLAGTAVALGPLVAEVSVRCRRIPTVPAWGRDVTIALDQPVELVAGQAFTIEFDTTTAAPVTAPAAPSAPSVGPAKPLLMNIPPALRTKTRLEPSGVLWRPELQRFIVVSDDTGQKEAGDRAPWLFAMGRDGAFDPEPLPIAGVGEIDDLESIAAGEGGEVYALASQSLSRHGKRPPSRTSFLRLMPDGRGFRADAEVHLADVLEAAGPAVMAKLGLPNGTRELDIEGMAYHNGALYLGLKAPLDPQGNAMLWRIGDPRLFFAQRSLEHAALSLWATAHIDAEAGGKSAPGGVSDLLFMPDGSLMITSTPSTSEATPQSGKLWSVATPAAGVLSPREIRAFSGLKPEGLSLSPTPGRVVIVFDAGGDVPSWLEIPWPE